MIETNKIRQAGFSLIELMVAVAIVGILTMMAVPAYMNYIYRTRQYDAQEVLMTIKAAQETFRADTGRYSTAINNLAGFSSAGTSAFYTSGYYRYTITSTTTANFRAMAVGDLNGDGNFFDWWVISNTSNQPTAMASGGKW